MIYEFTFENYRSYRHEATIDFTAKPINEFEQSLINGSNGQKLLPVCAIYGPNGGGKSSVIMAISELRSMVMQPLIQLAFMKKKNEKLGDASIDQLRESLSNVSTKNAYYKWDSEGAEKPIKYNILFEIESYKYRYEFEILKEDIFVENLYMENDGKVEVIFERDKESIYMCDQLESVDLENMNESLPILSYIAMFKDIDFIDRVIRFFMQIRILNYDRPSLDKRIFVKQIEKDKKRICNVIQSMGIDICDIHIDYNDDGSVDEIYTFHKLLSGEIKKLRLSEESGGTKKIISIIPVLLDGIDNSYLFLIDELDAKLHPLLTRYIINLFHNSQTNIGNGQLIYSTHDTVNLNKETFRRDEIWFAEKDKDGISEIYALSDYILEDDKNAGKKVRNDATYNKDYLTGRYGAIPVLEDFDIIHEE